VTERIGTVVREGATAQGNYTIRYLNQGDAPGMLDYINTLSREKTFILFQGEQLTLEHEEAHVTRQLQAIERNEVVNLLAIAGDRVIGIASVGMHNRVESHVAGLGISIAREWRGLGVGSALIEALLAEAQAHLPTLQIVTLSVFGNNETAIRMYQRFGFQEYGRLPRGIAHQGKYVDHMYMYLDVSPNAAQ